MYVKINTQEEADDIVSFVKSKGYDIDKNLPYSSIHYYFFRSWSKDKGYLNNFYFRGIAYEEDGELVSIEEFKRDLVDLNKEKTDSFDIVDAENRKILDSLHEMLVEKNKKYGDAALNPLEIFAGKCKYGYRVDEKLARVKNSEELCEADVVDILGGLVIICREKGWNDFSKYKN